MTDDDGLDLPWSLSESIASSLRLNSEIDGPFYPSWHGETLPYAITVTDRRDGTVYVIGRTDDPRFKGDDIFTRRNQATRHLNNLWKQEFLNDHGD
jgi:hypothetical protein